MTTWHHAWLAVRRRSTTPLILIITLIATAYILQAFTTGTLSQVRESAERQVTPGFTVSSPTGYVSTDVIEPLAGASHVVSHTLRIDTSAETRTSQFVGVIGSDNLAGLEPLGNLAAGSVPDGSAQAVISQATAAELGVDVGGTLTLTSADGQVDLTVTGLHTASPQDVYTDLVSAETLSGKNAVSAATYEVDSREHLDDVMTQARELLPEGLTIESSSAHVDDLISSVTGLATVLSRILWALLITASIILTLVLTFWTRSRIRQVGVLLAIGTPKARIYLQYAIELGILLIPSFIMATIVSAVAASAISSKMTEALSGVSGATLPSLSTLLPASAAGLVAMIVILLLAHTIATIPLLRLRPSRLLAAMS